MRADGSTGMNQEIGYLVPQNGDLGRINLHPEFLPPEGEF